METRKIIIGLALLFIAGSLLFTFCKKDNTTTTTTTTTATNSVNQVQTSESQDAVADKVETDVDSQLDELEANNYSSGDKKDAISSCLTITIDSTSRGGKLWPRTVILDYNCDDTVNGEKIIQTGIVTVTVDTSKKFKKMQGYTRIDSFKNYTITTDSSTLVLNGWRTMKRTNVISGIGSLELVDSITSDLTFSITYHDYKGTTDTTVTFTRQAARTRDIHLHYVKIGKKWHHIIMEDTAYINGQVSGLDIAGKAYIRKITSQLVYSRCPLWPFNPIISSGVIDINSNGTDIATITYSATGCKTEVTLTTADGKVKNKKINRKFGLGLKKWW